MTTTLPHFRSDRTKQAHLVEQVGIVQDCLATSRTATAKLAQALAVIHDEELYLLTHKSFEEFCAQEFDMTRSRGYQLLDFAKVVGNISANNCGHLTVPERESHARLLAPLPPAQQIEVARIVQETLDTEGRSKPSTADFDNAVRALGGNADDLDRQDTEPPPSDDGDDPPRDNGGAATPQWLFDYCSQLAVQACGEPITLDVAAAAWNHKCERYFTEADDGLKQNWDAKAVWCNPPFSATIIESFVRKALDAAHRGTTSLFLLPRWNYPYMDLCERHGRIHRICSPVSFQRQDGSGFAMNNRYSTTEIVIVAFGPTIRPGCGAPIRSGGTPQNDAKDPGNKDADLEGETGDVLDPATAADELLEPGRGLCEWNTPDWLFQLLDSEFHFTLDAAALPINTKCKKFFTPEDDGRKQNWAGEVVWCNPPFNREVFGLWVQKAYEESQQGAVVVMVLPTPFKGYKWWLQYCTQGQVRFIHQFVTFTQSEGDKKARIDVTIIVFGNGYTGAGRPIVEDMGHRFIGCDSDGKCVETGQSRIAEERAKRERLLDDLRIWIEETEELKAWRHCRGHLSRDCQRDIRDLWTMFSGEDMMEFETCLHLLPDSHRAIWKSLAQESA